METSRNPCRGRWPSLSALELAALRCSSRKSIRTSSRASTCEMTAPSHSNSAGYSAPSSMASHLFSHCFAPAKALHTTGSMAQVAQVLPGALAAWAKPWTTCFMA